MAMLARTSLGPVLWGSVARYASKVSAAPAGFPEEAWFLALVMASNAVSFMTGDIDDIWIKPLVRSNAI